MSSSDDRFKLALVGVKSDGITILSEIKVKYPFLIMYGV